MNCRSLMRGRACWGALCFACSVRLSALCQPVVVSTVPANGAVGVSTSALFITTFSQAMNTSATAVQFIANSMTVVPTTATWNTAATIVTNTPIPSWPGGASVQWVATGQNTIGQMLTPATGTFSVSSGGGGGGGSGTNAITTFALGKIFLNGQTNSGAPSPNPVAPYDFNASTTLASNRSATAITLTLPNAAVSNLTDNLVAPETWYLTSIYTNLTTFGNVWPDGNYTYTIISNSPVQTVTVTLPSTMVQPNAPHVTDYAASQSIDPTQPFNLTWDMFQNGTTTDYVAVAVGNNTNVFQTASPGSAGALNGTSTNVVIPANTLAANSNYSTTITFYRYIIVSNTSPVYGTFTYKATATQLTIITGAGGVSGPLVLTNAVAASGTFSFDVLSAAGQTFTVESATNMAGIWQRYLTTNSPGGKVHVTDAMTNRIELFRARDGT